MLRGDCSDRQYEVPIQYSTRMWIFLHNYLQSQGRGLSRRQFLPVLKYIQIWTCLALPAPHSKKNLRKKYCDTAEELRFFRRFFTIFSVEKLKNFHEKVCEQFQANFPGIFFYQCAQLTFFVSREDIYGCEVEKSQIYCPQFFCVPTLLRNRSARDYRPVHYCGLLEDIRDLCPYFWVFE